MEDTIVTIYCLCEEFLTAYGFEDDPQAQMSTAEVMTTLLAACAYYGGKIEISRLYLKQHGYCPRMLSKSRLNRRVHAIPPVVWEALFSVLAGVAKTTNESGEYLVDSFPVAVCDNLRIHRCRLYRGEKYRGWIASKRRYFYGLRVHLLVSATGQPVEFLLVEGAAHDHPVFKGFALDLPADSAIYADKAYNDYHYEDLLEEVGLKMKPLRKKNSKRPRPLWETYLIQYARKRVETAFSQLAALFPKHIHAVTSTGFELKVVGFILAFAFLSL